ncbi:MAG: hypothetical protein Q9191_004799 [Dirinaria sp. TL-2023a]
MPHLLSYRSVLVTELLNNTYQVGDLAKARAEALRFELQVYNNANSEEDYDQELEAKLGAIIPVTPNVPPEAYLPHTQGYSSHPTEQIGVYQATYHASGIFSTVYKAHDPSTNSVIALKLTKPSQAQPPHDPRREARILAAGTHVSVVRLISTFSLPGAHFVLVFPFLSHDLGTLLDSAPLSVRKNVIFKNQARSHLKSLFSALAHVHAQGIIHRDIKPSNILLASPAGPAYLADFGISWMAGDPASEPPNEKITDVGTTCYRPPELLFGYKAYGCALDLWAAGCVVAEVLGTGELFNCGDMGSELALIHSHFTTLGTPNNETWPEARNYDAWGKFGFKQYDAKPWAQLLPDASDEARDLVSQLVRFESASRLAAVAVLQHPWFNTASA